MGSTDFNSMGLDDRLLESVAELGWSEPTLIQSRAVPLILEGKDLLARGRTGSGKTGAFALPVLQRLLLGESTGSVRALFLAPSRELVQQIHGVVRSLLSHCGRSISIGNLSMGENLEAGRALLKTPPDLLVSTPGRLWSHIQAKDIDLSSSLEILVIDEADLTFSFGYESDLKGILINLPSIYQSVLTSATLSEDVNKLKKLVLHNPVILQLEEPQLAEASQLAQYLIKIEEEDKFLLIYALFKLRLIQGKTIIFVNNVDRCYKIKLFLEQFGIPVCVLNSELPAASRCHIVTQFNKGIYDIIVASDENFLHCSNPNDKDKGKRKKDTESGISRGIDFQFVSNVINFDFPLDVDSYIHRVGRTARGNNTGTALSMIAVKEMLRLEEIEEELKEKMYTESSVFRPYQFKLEELNGFRYRTRDAWRGVTKIAIREARLKELKQEILKSTELRAHFEDNPRDAQILRHDKSLFTVKHQVHMKNVPDYIIPKALKNIVPTGNRRSHAKRKISSAKRRYETAKSDPLLSMYHSKKKC
uniref:RNA helicase n=1 Tax=Lepeophtheirus salmonis TaxID=72036 RepID=A0A0K2TD92_LEPSM